MALNHLENKISQAMNESLCRDMSPAEIKKTVFSIHPEKTPGPDGMTGLFYQKYWSTIGPQVIKMVQDFFHSDSFDPQLNETNICLIPKSEQPRDITNFRPISLCNFCYNIISKVLCQNCVAIYQKLSRKLNLPLCQEVPSRIISF